MSAAARAFFKSVGLPAVGFGIGWAGFTLVEQNDLLSASTQRWLNVTNLKLQVYAQRVLPAAVVDKYGFPEETLQAMIGLLEKGYSEAAVAERMTFDEVLRQCPVPEQMAYLEEHAMEEIPYFYIADIFHSWANLNTASYLRSCASSSAASSAASEGPATSSPAAVLPGKTGGGAPLVLRNDADFDSEVLCSALWDRMVHNVIPFDVSVRALCVLAVNNKANAQRLARLASPATVLERYNAYTDKVTAAEEQGSGAEVVTPEEVAAATLFFLRAINDASVHTRWVPLVGAPSTGPYPLARQVQPEPWCRAFGELRPAVTAATAETAVVLVDVVSERLRCNELRSAESAAPPASS